MQNFRTLVFVASFATIPSAVGQTVTADRALLMEAIRVHQDQFRTVPCHLLNLVPSGKIGEQNPNKNITAQHFAFPRSIVMEDEEFDNGSRYYGLCPHGKCTAAVYRGLTPRDIMHQHYLPFEKVYFYTVEGTESTTDDKGNDIQPPAEQGRPLGFGTYRVYKERSPFQEYIGISSARYFDPYFGDGSSRSPRLPKDSNRPYVVPELKPRFDGHGDYYRTTLSERIAFRFQVSSEYEPLDQEGRRKWCNRTMNCVHYMEVCVASDLKGFDFDNALDPADVNRRFSDNEGALRVYYRPYVDPPVYLGYTQTQNVDLEKLVQAYNFAEGGLLVVASVTPLLGSGMEVASCIADSSPECWAGAAVSIAGDVSSFLVPVSKTAGLMKQINRLSEISPQRLEKIARSTFRIEMGISFTLAVVHSKRGDLVKALGYSLGPIANLEVITYTRGIVRYAKWKKFGSFADETCANKAASAVANLSEKGVVAETLTRPRNLFNGPVVDPVEFPDVPDIGNIQIGDEYLDPIRLAPTTYVSHGTSATHARSILINGIEPGYGKGYWGEGLYLTPTKLDATGKSTPIIINKAVADPNEKAIKAGIFWSEKAAADVDKKVILVGEISTAEAKVANLVAAPTFWPEKGRVPLTAMDDKALFSRTAHYDFVNGDHRPHTGGNDGAGFPANGNVVVARASSNPYVSFGYVLEVEDGKVTKVLSTDEWLKQLP